MSEVFHFDGQLLRVAGTKGRVPGPDPEGRSYFSFASFSDPDGNSWLLQQVTTRLPGRGLSLDVATLTELLQEAEKRHGEYEPTAPKHHWSDGTPDTSWRASGDGVPRKRPKMAHSASNVPATACGHRGSRAIRLSHVIGQFRTASGPGELSPESNRRWHGDALPCAETLDAANTHGRSDVEPPLESPAEEVTRLRDSLNDLRGIMALPAVWTGGEPPRIVSTSLDALLGIANELRNASHNASANSP